MPQRWEMPECHCGRRQEPLPWVQQQYREGVTALTLSITNVFNEYELAGFSTYNAFQVKLEKRFANDFNFLVSYTVAKTMDSSGSQLAAYFSAGAQDSFNRKAEKSVSDNDIPQSLVFSYNYELPFGPGKKFATKGGVAGKFTGGWSFSGIQTLSERVSGLVEGQ